jgi:phosphoserine phosphatase RsbU/P
MEETKLFILPGKNKRHALSLAKTLSKCRVEIVIKDSSRIDESEQGIYLCAFVPQYHRFIEKLRAIARSGNPVISLYQVSDAKKKLHDFILYLPLLATAQVKRATVEWLAYQEKNSLELRSVLGQLESRRREMVRELALASELQKSMLPKKFPEGIAFNFAHKYVPHEYLGGDLFDVIKINDMYLGIFIADASGHGVAAAFVIAMVKILFNHYAPASPSPAATIKRINDELCVMIQEHFITAFYAIIDLETLDCRYASAGHPRQLLIRKTGEIEELKPNGFLIGMFDHVQWEDIPLKLNSGDKLFCYTDGIIEVTDDEGTLFGYERLTELVRKSMNEDIVSMSNDMLTNIIMFMKGTVFPDDITILIAEALEEI